MFEKEKTVWKKKCDIFLESSDTADEDHKGILSTWGLNIDTQLNMFYGFWLEFELYFVSKSAFAVDKFTTVTLLCTVWVPAQSYDQQVIK